MNYTKVSRFISLILRHKPETIGISLDEHGWANVDELIKGTSNVYPITIDILEKIVETDDKQRYSFNDDHTLIRANQGHSIPVDVELEELEPPEYLYHGSGTKYLDSIWKEGLVSKSRLYVHLSGSVETATEVGKRHGNPVVFRVLSGNMYRLGYKFYKSKNGVWMVDKVPVRFLEVVKYG